MLLNYCIESPKYTCLFMINWVFLNSIANRFSEKQFLYDNLVLIPKKFFLLRLLEVWDLCVSNIFNDFYKTCIIHKLEQVFLKIIFCFFFRLVFISISNFNQAFLLKSLCTSISLYISLMQVFIWLYVSFLTLINDLMIVLNF